MDAGDRVTLSRTARSQRRYLQPTDVGNYDEEAEEDPRDKHSRQPQEPRFNINVDGGVDYTPLCLSRAFGNLYTAARPPPCDAYSGPYIKCVRTNGSGDQDHSRRPRWERETDRTRGTRRKKRDR